MDNVSCQTDFSAKHLTGMEELKKHEVTIRELKMALEKKNRYSEQFFEGDDERVLYYTGLPNFITLLGLHKLLGQDILPRYCLSSFQQLVLCLMRMRLNVPLQDLSDRFDIHRSSASHIYLHMTDT